MGAAISPQIEAMLAAMGVRVRGSIRCRQVCPQCGQRGKFQPRAIRLPGKRPLEVLACECGRWADAAIDIRLKWQGKLHVIGHDKSGNPFASYDDACVAQAQINDEIDEGRFYPEEWSAKAHNGLLWENYHQAYLEHEKARLLPDREATWTKKRGMARHLAWFNGQNVREIRAGQIQDFDLHLKALGLAPKTRADVLAELRFVLRWAALREDIAKVPAFPVVQVPEKEIGWYNQDQQQQILDKLPEEHRPIFAFMFTYGCRVNEATALCWDKLDRANGLFYLARTFSRRRLRDRPKEKPNVLPISQSFAAYLEAAIPSFGPLPVFRNPEARNKEGFYLEDHLRRLFVAAAKAAGLPEIPLKNATRHSLGMQAINVHQWGIEAASRILGHTSLAHTRKYARAGTGLVRDLLDQKVLTLPTKTSKPK